MLAGAYDNEMFSLLLKLGADPFTKLKPTYVVRSYDLLTEEQAEHACFVRVIIQLCAWRMYSSRKASPISVLPIDLIQKLASLIASPLFKAHIAS
jgi:hypothetical protein